MLATRHRFHGYNSLNHVYKNGTPLRGQLFLVRYIKNPKRKDYRVAVVVSKKVHKSAVTRNRIRRRIYEVIRSAGIVGSYDIVVTVFDESVASLPAGTLRDQLMKRLSPLLPKTS